MWNDGYITEIDYTHGYYPELSPQRLKFCLNSCGIEFELAPNFKYLELGFGQGVAINVHAAASLGEFWGTDFNPAQAHNAIKLGKSSQAQINAFDLSFEEFGKRDDLPEFDIIALHGIWSWVSEQNRREIVKIIRKVLRPGGIVYISYNANPCWSPTIPLRNLLVEHARRIGVGNLEEKISGSINFAKQIKDAGAQYFEANPTVSDWLATLDENPTAYLAHEYYHDEWHPMSFSEASSLLAEAKIKFGASAHPLDQIDEINFSEKARSLFGGITDEIFRETVRDYFRNVRFRRDIFIKGSRLLSPAERTKILEKAAFVLQKRPKDRSTHVVGVLGKADLQDAVYAPIVDYLGAGDYAPKTIAEIREHCPTIQFSQIVQALQVLIGLGEVAPAQAPDITSSVKEKTSLLNQEICRRAETSGDIFALASPVTGSAVLLNRFEQLFVQGSKMGEPNIPVYVWDILKAQNEKIIKDEKPLEGDAENIDEIRKRFKEFEEKRLPIIKALGVL